MSTGVCLRRGREGCWSWITQRLPDPVDLGQFALPGLPAVGTLYIPHKPDVHLGRMGPLCLFHVGGAIGITGLGIGLVTSVLPNIRSLYLTETLPR